MSEQPTTSTNEFRGVTPALVFGVMAGYFLLQLLLRVWVSDSLQIDEAEMIALSQEWRWGYDSQPPLYTWLQKMVFAVTGESVFGLALLKNALLFAIYLFTYLSAREVLKRNHLALLAAASLALIPTVVFESQRDRTHVVVATLCSTVTLFALLRLIKTGKLVWYVVMGALVGAGLLSKYSYVVFPVALLLAAASFKQTRGALLNRKLLLSAVSFLVVAGPHCMWAWNHPDLFLHQSYKFHIPAQNGGIGTVLMGIQQLLFEVGQFAGPSIVVCLIVLIGSTRSNSSGGEDAFPGCLVERTLVFGLAICVAAVIGFQVTSVKARWLQPILIALPIVLVFRARHRLTRGRIRALFVVASFVAAGMLCRPIALRTGLAAERYDLLSVSFNSLADQIRRAGFESGMIVAESRWLAGNLRLKFKDSKAVSEGMSYLEPRKNVPILIVWNASSKEMSDEDFLDYARSLAGRELQQEDARFVSAARQHGGKVTRLGFFLVSPTQGSGQFSEPRQRLL